MAEGYIGTPPPHRPDHACRVTHCHNLLIQQTNKTPRSHIHVDKVILSPPLQRTGPDLPPHAVIMDLRLSTNTTRRHRQTEKQGPKHLLQTAALRTGCGETMKKQRGGGVWR